MMLVCSICKKKIIEEDQDYCRLTDYHQGKFLKEGFYHTECFNRKIYSGIAQNSEQLMKKSEEIFRRFMKKANES